MFRKMLSSAIALASLASAPALAADLAYPTKAPAYAPAVPVFTWTGFYLGGNVGWGWTGVDNVAPFYAPGYASYGGGWSQGGLDGDGWFGGFQAGYNYQFANNVVLGAEADVQFADISKTYSFGYSAISSNGDYDSYASSITAKIDSFGTIRARLGYAVDHLLPYVTGGFAWANAKVSGNGTVDGGNWYSESNSDTYWGWSIGAGAEYAVTDNWTIKAEYIYSDLGATNFNEMFSSNDLDFSIQTLKVGVNYKF
ncbi:outer membrane protein [Ancylobacter lacus]|uniref:outer membrane protein n=1 Tax=Ancylobacter lacus TaxID=2579970 RepID=UPI001BCD2993|nr:outer membrane protein [Ancylobacter lacus]MBS7540633.1 porin family protein [Ancylobacter lacus]